MHGTFGFVEQFDTQDPSFWNYNPNGGNIVYGNSVINLSNGVNGFPLVHKIGSGDLFFEGQDSDLEIRFKYEKITSGGVGIGIGFTGVNGRPFYEFALWADAYNGGIYFMNNDFFTPVYGNCNNFANQDYYSYLNTVFLQNDSDWHVLRIEKKGKRWVDEKYYVYFDKYDNPEPIFVSGIYPCYPRNLWMGNPLGGGYGSFSVDYIATGLNLSIPVPSVSINPSPTIIPTVVPTATPEPTIPIPTLTLAPTLTPTLTPSPTPTLVPTSTPTPTPRTKIIFLPGMGASWNSRAIVYNEVLPNSEWKMTPFVNNYNSLFHAFESNNLKKNIDYFVWNYDWRRPLSQSVLDLNNFINLKIGSDEKFSLVGHSMGAMISRIWAQDHLGDSRLVKVIAVAGPQHGALDTYDLWNGATVNQKNDLSTIALNILVQLQKYKYKTKVETVRNIAPSIKDVLPLFNFAKRNGQKLDYRLMSSVNNYLESKNNLLSIGNNIEYIAGTNYLTKEWVNLDPPNAYEANLGIWPEGRPKSYSFSDAGDGTVLKKSVSLNPLYDVVSSNHGEIISKSVNQILEKLDLGNTIATSQNNSFYPDNKLVFFIGSPAKIRLVCDGRVVGENDEEGFLIIEDLAGKCFVDVVGTSSGIFHLVGGRVGMDFDYIEGSTYFGKIDRLEFDRSLSVFVGGKSTWSQSLSDGLLKLERLYPREKIIGELKEKLKKQEYLDFAEKLAKFRKTHKETIITNAMFDSLRGIISLEIRDRKEKMRNMGFGDGKILGNRKLKSEFDSLNRIKIEEYKEDSIRSFSSGLYYRAWANLILANLLLI